MDKIPKEGEVGFDTDYIYRVGQYLKELPIFNNSTTVIFAIRNRGELGDILEYLRLVPYESWADMENYDN